MLFVRVAYSGVHMY